MFKFAFELQIGTRRWARDNQDSHISEFVRDRVMEVVDLSNPRWRPGSLVTATELLEAAEVTPDIEMTRQCATLLTQLGIEPKLTNGNLKYLVPLKLRECRYPSAPLDEDLTY